MMATACAAIIPDIEDFITAKSDAARLRNFNMSRCW
jgi:ribonucleotide reductase alpha subunit